MPRRVNLKGDKYQACVERIAAKGRIGTADALKLLSEVANRGEKMRTTGIADPFVKAAGDLAETIKTRARKDALDAWRNALIRKTELAKIDESGGIRNATQVLKDLLYGRAGIESLWRGYASGWQGILSYKITAAGAEKLARTGQIDSEIAQNIYLLDSGGTITGTGPARAVAEAIWPLLNEVRRQLNRVGAVIGDAGDYIAHTSHDPDKMLRAAGPGKSQAEAFEAWWAATEPRLAQKTFDGLVPEANETMNDARRRFGRSFFDATSSGIHMTPDGAFGLKADNTYAAPAFEGTHNLARKLSQPRVLFWQDGTAWAAHMKQFGKRTTLVENVMGSLDTAARHLALMERLGTNPSANFNQIVRRIEEVGRTDNKGLSRFQNSKSFLNAVMGQLDGTANRPAYQMAMRIAASVRTWESVSYLGGVGLTHFASIWPTVTSEMTHHGVSRLHMLGKLMTAMVQGRGSLERQEVMAQLGAYSAGLVRDMQATWQPDADIPGRLSSMASTFMKWTGIHYVFDNTQAAVREVLANQLARFNGKGFGELDPHLAAMLNRYGIGEAEWNLLREVKDLAKADGMSYMTPLTAHQIDAAKAEALLRARGMIAPNASAETIAKAVKDLQDDLSGKLYSYYADAAVHSTVTAGVRERAIANNWAQPGSLPGELARFVMQFKMWPLAAMHQVIARDVQISLSRGEMAWNLGIMAALSMTAGYFRMSVNDLATGRPVRNPLDPNTMVAALAQGGGVGILGDFLFGEVNRFEGGLIGTLGGPVVSDGDQLVKIFGDWRQGEAGWPQLARFAVRHVPFGNLIYVKGVLDYMAWYHLYEAASPGWWERTNRRLIREQGRAMTGYRPGQGVPWTPWGIDFGTTRATGPVGQPTFR